MVYFYMKIEMEIRLNCHAVRSASSFTFYMNFNKHEICDNPYFATTCDQLKSLSHDQYLEWSKLKSFGDEFKIAVFRNFWAKDQRNIVLLCCPSVHLSVCTKLM